MDSTEAARLLAARRTRKQLTCRYCGKAFETISTRRYCSPSCRQMAYIRRKRQTPKAE